MSAANEEGVYPLNDKINLLRTIEIQDRIIEMQSGVIKELFVSLMNYATMEEIEETEAFRKMKRAETLKDIK